MEERTMKEKYTTPEDIIIYKIDQNRGTQNFIFKEELIQIAKENDIKDITNKMDKKAIAIKIADKIGYVELAKKANVGVSSKELQDKFGITNDDIKRMAKNGFLTIVGKEPFRMYGKTRYANLYSAYDYFKSEEEIKQWLEDHSKK